MKKDKKTTIILAIIIILILTCIIFYKIKNNIPRKISKNGAINLCKYIVYNKIDPTLENNLKDVICEIDKSTVNIILIFTVDSINKNVVQSTYTKAYCTFDSIYKGNNVLLKKFSYKDIKNKTYLYFETSVHIL